LNTADATLLHAWIENHDPKAFEQIVRKYAGLVYSAANRILGNHSDAEEIAQECFLVLVNADPPGPRSLPAWLHAVSTRRSLNRLRSDIARTRREIAQVENIPDSVEPAWDDVKAYVDEAIEQLPEELRYSVTTHFLLQRTQKSIADELGVTRQTISRRVGRGVEEIRKLLTKRGITVPAAALLGSFFEANAHATPPTAVVASLGKLAGSGNIAKGSVSSYVAATGQSTLLKWGGAVALALFVAGAVYLFPPDTPETQNGPRASTTIPETTTPETPQAASFSTAAAARLRSSGDSEPQEVVDIVADEEEPTAARTNRFVTGRVTYADTGDPVYPATVKAENIVKRKTTSGRSFSIRRVEFGDTDPQGNFKIEKLYPRSYTLQVTHEKETFECEWPVVNMRGNTFVEDIEIGVSFPLIDDVVIEGRATLGGRHISEGAITITYDPISRVYDWNKVPMDPRTIKLQGKEKYTLSGLAAGTAAVTMVFGQIRITRLVDLEAAEKYVLNFDLPEYRDGVVEGRITLPQGADGVVVFAYWDNRDGNSIGWNTRTNSDGQYRFEGLPAGEVEIAVMPPIVTPDLSPHNLNRATGTLRLVTSADGTTLVDTLTTADGVTRVEKVNYAAIVYPEGVVRLSHGTWTNRSLTLPTNNVDRKKERLYPPRQYYGSYEHALIDANPEYEFHVDIRTRFVTVISGETASLDFDLLGEDNSVAD
jgi:RNA polymerase sigma-70 factor (ECF subfamily)